MKEIEGPNKATITIRAQHVPSKKHLCEQAVDGM